MIAARAPAARANPMINQGEIKVVPYPQAILRQISKCQSLDQILYVGFRNIIVAPSRALALYFKKNPVYFFVGYHPGNGCYVILAQLGVENKVLGHPTP